MIGSIRHNESESLFNYTLTDGNFSSHNTYSKPRFLEELVNNLTLLFKGHLQKDIDTFKNICKNSWDDTSDTQCLLTIARTNSTNAGMDIHQLRENAHEKYLRDRKWF